MIDPIDSQEIGILILAEFSILETEMKGFMHAASPGKEVLTLEEGLTLEELQRLQALFEGVPRPQPLTQFKFRNPNQHPIGLMGVYWCRYWLPTKKCNLTLLHIPYAATLTFQLSDLEIPLRLAGCVLIVDLKRFYQMKNFVTNQFESPSDEKEVEFQKIWAGELPRPVEMPSDEWIAEQFKNLLKRERSATSKVKQAKLPFVVVPIEPYSYTPKPAMSLEEISDLLELEHHISIIPCKLTYNNIGSGINKETEFPFSREDVVRVLSVLMEQIEAAGGL